MSRSRRPPVQMGYRGAFPLRFPTDMTTTSDGRRLVRSDLLEAWVGVTLRCWQLERKLPALTLQFKPLTSSSGSSILTHRYLGTVVLRISHRGGSYAVSTSGNSRGPNRGQHTSKCDPRGKPDPHNHADLAL